MRKKILQWISLAAAVLVAAQIGIILATGEALCPTEGCAIVEKTTAITPLQLNLIGFVFFLALFICLRWEVRRSKKESHVSAWLILGGVAAEAVLFSFQVFLIQTFCLYCLLIFLMVLLLAFLAGFRQAIASAAVITATLLTFSFLDFSSAVSSETVTLEDGIYGSRACTTPTKELYLIFSETCPHCMDVVDALKMCNSCSLHLNPIHQVDELPFAGIQKNDAYSPRANRQVLSAFGIDTIPVLLAKIPDGFQIIQGENRIINYIQHSCFQSDPTLYLDRSHYSGGSPISIFPDEEGECTVNVNCNAIGTTRQSTDLPLGGGISTCDEKDGCSVEGIDVKTSPKPQMHF